MDTPKPLYDAGKVVNNIDPLRAGRVQIRVPARMGDPTKSLEFWPDAVLPWAYDEDGGGSNLYGTSDTPPIGTLVWVRFDDPGQWRHPYYRMGINLLRHNPHGLFDLNVRTKLAGPGGGWSTALGPNTKFRYFRNGVCFAVSDDPTSPEFVAMHPSGLFVHVTRAGVMTVTKGADSLGIVLSDLLTQIMGLTVITGDGESSNPKNTPAFAAIQSRLATFLV